MARTSADFDKMQSNDEWEGFGYLGERRNQKAEGRSTEAADAKALAEADRLGLTDAELFEWANSKKGRWYGDCVFGSNGSHAEKYLPTRNAYGY